MGNICYQLWSNGCIFAGSLALAGDLEDAAALQESNYNMWMIKGIEPEEIDYRSMKVTSPGYALRP